MNYKKLSFFLTALTMGSCASLSASAVEISPVIEEVTEVGTTDISENDTDVDEAESEAEAESESTSEFDPASLKRDSFKYYVYSQLKNQSRDNCSEGTLQNQGLFEIASAQNSDLTLDIKHCLQNTMVGKQLQLFQSQNVNQQKFYIECEASSYYSIRSLYSGSYLTGTGESPSVARRNKVPLWKLRSAGDGRWYIQSQDGRYLTLGDAAPYNGTEVTLSPFSGEKNQLWILKPTQISVTDFAETDFPNPFARYGTLEHMDLKLTSALGEDTLTAAELSDGLLITGEHRYLFRSGFFLPFAGELAEKYNNQGETRAFRTTDNRVILLEQGNYGWVLNQENTADYLAEALTELSAVKPLSPVPAALPSDVLLTEETDIEKTTSETDMRETETTETDPDESDLRNYDLLKAQILTGSIHDIQIEPVWDVEHNDVMSPGALNDIGDSYVEVDITNQTVWLYEDGKQVLETSCVTGHPDNPSSHTPEGVYAIQYRQSPAVLNGPGYSSPVTYWMAFSGGFGLHDATWRSEFGGSIYLTNGSHGCVNLPLDKAEIIYQTAVKGFPVVLYY